MNVQLVGRHDVVSAAPAARPAILEVEDLHIAFPSRLGPREVVRGISFTIGAGEILAIVGESGSGKSVTARALVGLAGSGAELRARSLRLSGHDGEARSLTELSERQWSKIRGREIGFVLQDALVSLDPLRRIGREVGEPLLTHALVPRAEIGKEVETLLARVGIPDPAVRAAQYPHELSGGLRQRALIASALAARPRLLIADEPTTALDVTIQQQILSVFQALAKAGHGILLITHDLAVAAQLADRIAVMQNGELVETGPAREVLRKPRHAYTQRLLSAVPSAATRGRWLSTSGARPVKAQPERSQPILALRDIAVRFTRPDRSVTHAANGVSLHVYPGETLGIVGESGSGKTTIGKVALALRNPDAGEVLFRGQAWSQLSERQRRPLRRHVQTIVQDPLNSFDPRYAVERIIEQPLLLHTDLGKAARSARVRELIQLVNLPPDVLDRRPTALSGGQRQRVSIAQALASEPDLLICDEPVSALDVTTQAQVLDLLIALQHRLGLAMLFISHDLGVIRHMSDRIAVMKDGVIVETGAAEEVFDAPKHDYTRRLLEAVPKL
ncbi:ABC transporter ATP-binding protein [Bosea sp. SSUT16]|jgi:peptide/nickel transport system ATP-binding protein|uniref:ABC transporter ATP-binding protein n=1 Tax=Bosea spartocytisi TaxID=2773451 RepID=A0A927E3D7_9HYPH|nr:ABC transporter ATP-binding protein [Bosea spartocytisi]MBD3844086.1 ABC transporter ATP-binding protein [Bosea spartocytisi]MCT4470806.1 ABC transporter ATP-binding protein [Bosea spartocytisi]